MEGKVGSPSRDLSTLFADGVIGGASDERLIEHFLSGDGANSQIAFTAIVERHGSMVLRAAQRIVRDSQLAEDVFQATFIVLARKARGLRVEDSLAPWLYTAACRIASSARRSQNRRTWHERKAATPEAYVELGESAWITALREEIERLPDRLRHPIVLCELEGKTGEQAAELLGWRVGTVWSRLSRGRHRLRDRLKHRGLEPSNLTFAALSVHQLYSKVPPWLKESTIQAGTQAAKGSLPAKALSSSVFKLVKGDSSMIILKSILTSAIAVLLPLGVISSYLAPQPNNAPQVPATPRPPVVDIDERIRPLLGTWIEQVDGRPNSDGSRIRIRLLSSDPAIARGLGFEAPFVCTLMYVTSGESSTKPSMLLIVDPSKNPSHLTYQPLGYGPGDTSWLDGSPAIYRIEGQKLSICRAGRVDGKRPGRFERSEEPEVSLEVYRRETEEDRRQRDAEEKSSKPASGVQ